MIVGAGFVKPGNNAMVRPRFVEVLFDRRCELRFDFLEDDFVPSSSPALEPGDRYLENVLPSPDFLIEVDGRKYSQGNFFTIDRAVRAWVKPTGTLVSFGNSSDNYVGIRRAFVPYVDLFAALAVTGSLNANDLQSEWFARAAALKTHYRQTFRIPKDWLDAIKDLRAELISTIDPVFGQFSPARVWADHSYTRSLKTLFHADRDKDFPMVVNVDGYPGRDVDLATKKPSPAKVTLLDKDQGVFNVSYQIDPYSKQEIIFPSKMDNVPNMGALDRILTAFSSDSVIADSPDDLTMQPPELAAQHKMALLCSAVPLTPNSTDALHKITLSLNSLKFLKIVPDHVLTAENSDAIGPTMQIRISPTIAEALIRWVDGKEKIIERCFGKGGTPPTAAELRSNDLLLNEDTATSNGAAGVFDIALAAAASVYTRFANGIQGGMTGRMFGSAEPVGRITSIAHLLDEKGRANTRYTIVPEVNLPDILAFADERTRKYILRQSRI